MNVSANKIWTWVEQSNEHEKKSYLTLNKVHKMFTLDMELPVRSYMRAGQGLQNVHSWTKKTKPIFHNWTWKWKCSNPNSEQEANKMITFEPYK